VSPVSTPATRPCGAGHRSSWTGVPNSASGRRSFRGSPPSPRSPRWPGGVSSFSAVAALARRELTIPEVAQSVVLTRLGGGKTPMPPGEEVREFARHGTTMAIFLSAARSGQLVRELLEGGYPTTTPVIVAHQATWPEELVVQCTVGTLEETVKEHKLWKHTLFLVGPALAAHGTRSHLYHPGHFHGYRKADPEARKALRARGAST